MTKSEFMEMAKDINAMTEAAADAVARPMQEQIRRLQAEIDELKAENERLKKAILAAPGAAESGFLNIYRKWWDDNFRPLRAIEDRKEGKRLRDAVREMWP